MSSTKEEQIGQHGLVHSRVGYAFGFSWVTGDTFPIGVVTIGLVSKTGATILLVLTGAWLQALHMTVFLTGIATSLALAMASPDMVLQAL